MEEPSALKVRHWKIIVSSNDTGRNYLDSIPSGILIDACKLMYASKPQSLEVLVIPRGIEAMPNGDHDDHYHDIHAILRPLHLLRFREDQFSIRDASFNEVCPYFHETMIVPVYVSQLEGTNSQDVLVNIIQGNTPVEIGLDMYTRLLSYARCFERYPPLKSEMGLEWNESLPEEELRSIDIRHFELNLINPFKDDSRPYSPQKNIHPVEEDLYQAKCDTESEDLAGFKDKRATILKYLESQYLRIMDASTKLFKFIKNHKQQDGMFDYKDEGWCWCHDSE
jgi:hypothetical protein